MQGFEYHVDIVFCIDVTASMTPVLEEVKKHAMRFHGDVVSALDEKDKHVDRMRVKIVAFRDVFDSMDTAFEISEFFNLPDQSDKFDAFIRGLRPIGGGDEPESALEGLALALNADWTKEGAKRRHVVVMWTDASAHPLEKASSARPERYPEGLPSSFDELADLWQGQSAELSSRRLIVFAPDAQPWSLVQHWEGVIWLPSRAGSGLDELTHAEIVSAIVNSVG